MGRKRRIGSRHVPVAGHSEVNMEHRAVVQMKELVLPPPLHPLDPPTSDPASLAWAEGPPHRGMQRARRDDASAGHGIAQRPNGELDFGKLRHVSIGREGSEM